MEIERTIKLGVHGFADVDLSSLSSYETDEAGPLLQGVVNSDQHDMQQGTHSPDGGHDGGRKRRWETRGAMAAVAEKAPHALPCRGAPALRRGGSRDHLTERAQSRCPFT